MMKENIGDNSRRLKSLAHLIENSQGCNPAGARIVLVIHLLDTAVEYIEWINKFCKVELIIPIPYSLDQQVANRLLKRGYHLHIPSSIDEMFVSVFEQVEQLLLQHSFPLVVQEVGGYLANYTYQLSRFPHFLGIVEGTKNGLWNYEKVQTDFFPVISIAKSPLKNIEADLTGDAIVYSIEKILRDEFATSFQGKQVGVIGYGKIGKATVQALQARKALVTIADISANKLIEAHFKGINFTTSLRDLFARSQVIIGCSGHRSTKVQDALQLPNSAIIANASSKELEFDLQEFGQHFQSKAVSSVVRKYTKPNGEEFYLLAAGTPVNFKDRSILGSCLDLIYSELFVCIRTIIMQQSKSGLQLTNKDIHHEVSIAWLEKHIQE